MKSKLVACVWGLTLSVAASAAWGETFKARLSGDQEVSPVTTETSGKLKLKFNKAETEAGFTLTVDDGVGITQAHLHCAPAGVNGPVVAFLAGFHATGHKVDGKWISNATLTNGNIINATCGNTLKDLAAAMRAGMVYANVHSVAHPGGVVRGQVSVSGDDD